MDTVTITSEEYLELLTIKNNAHTLSITMNEEYRNIVQNLCQEHNDKTVDRIQAKIDLLEKSIAKYEKVKYMKIDIKTITEVTGLSAN